MADVILICPPYSRIIYGKAKIKAGVPINPLLNLALLASPPIKADFKPKILDLNLIDDCDSFLRQEIRNEKPKFAGFTFTTPLFQESTRLARIIKETDANIKLIAGGPHATTFPEEILENSPFDIVAVGESDFVIKDLLELPVENVQGIVFKKDGAIVRNEKHKRIDDLDTLPFPAWNLYDLSKYNTPSLSNIASPPGYLETSRGCPWNCVFCNKNIHGFKFRMKTPERVVDEIEYMLKVGFKEINLIDDTFNADIVRAKLICEEIIKRGIKFPWHPNNGMRVDRVDRELFSLMKRSGCYTVSFGLESGNQTILNNINKGIRLEQSEQAVRLAKLEGMETFGFFMLGLPGETEKTMQDTINFAKRLKLDVAKFNITIPLPGTKMFNEWEAKGNIKTKDWSKYNYYSPYEDIYDHPTLSHDILNKYYRKAFLSFYFSPSLLLRRFVGGIKRKTILRDIKLFFQTNWLS